MEIARPKQHTGQQKRKARQKIKDYRTRNLSKPSTLQTSLVALPLRMHKILQLRPSGRATLKQLNSANESRPPTWF